MTLKKVVLELARDHDFPNGSRAHGYRFTAPLTADGKIDPDGWKAHRDQCRVHAVKLPLRAGRQFVHEVSFGLESVRSNDRGVGDERASPAGGPDQPLGLERRDRLPQRHQGDAEPVGHLLLRRQLRPGRQLTGEDPLAQRRVDRLVLRHP